MADNSTSHTSATLLELVRDPANFVAWEEFAQRYRPRIVRWCRDWGVQEADAEDVAQLVLVKLIDKLKTFRYDPSRSFRAWLRTVTRNVCHDLQTSSRGREDSRASCLESVQAQDDMDHRLAELFDQELLEAAMLRVQARVEPQTWEAFHLTAIVGLSGAEAAAKLGQPVAQVFVAKHRVQKRIREEVRKIDGGSEPA